LGKTIVRRQGVTRVLAIDLPIGDRFTDEEDSIGALTPRWMACAQAFIKWAGARLIRPTSHHAA
jgi:hypothetical protein